MHTKGWRLSLCCKVCGLATTQWPLVSRASGINRSKMDSHVCSLDETLLPSLSFCYQIGYCPSHRMVIVHIGHGNCSVNDYN